MKKLLSNRTCTVGALFLALAHTPLLADTDALKFNLGSSWPGYTRGGPALQVTVVSNLAYVALNAAGLAIFDISQPTTPVRVGGYKSRTNGYARAVQVVGNFAFVAAWTGGLRVLDISRPSAPAEVSRADTGGWAQHLQIVAHYAYVSWSRPSGDDDVEGLDIFDVSNPATPVRLGSTILSDAGFGGEIQVSGNYAYLAGKTFNGASYVGGLSVINVSNPANPVRVGGFVANELVVGVQLSGHYAYLSAGSLGLIVVDVSNPASPVRVGGYDTPGYARAARLSGNYAYVADAGGGLQIISIADPAHPTRVASYDTGAAAWDVFVSGGYAYIGDDVGGLQVLDVSNPSSPGRVGRFNGNEGNAFHVEVSGAYAYVADLEAGLQVIDVSDPARPLRAGGYRTNLTARTLRLSGNYVYVLGYRSTPSNYIGGLEILSITNPMSPVRVGGYSTDNTAEGLDVAGSLAYIAGFGNWTGSNYFGGLKIMDVSNPANPVLVSSSGESFTAAFARAIRVAGHYAYVSGDAKIWTGSNYLGAFQIFDVADPAHPVLVGNAPTSDQTAWGVALAGKYAYLANQYAGLQIFDVSNPADPVSVGGLRTPYAFDVSVTNNYAFLVGGPPALQVIDVINPREPRRVGGFDNGEVARGIQVIGSRAYMASGYAGLTILDITRLPCFRAISRSGGRLALTWDHFPGRKLQHAAVVTDPVWADVSVLDGQGYYESPFGEGSHFFRLAEP